MERASTMKEADSLKVVVRAGALSFLVGVLLLILFFGQAPRRNFSDEARAQIEAVAKRVCAAAHEEHCTVAWGGKHKWFGKLEPSATGRAVAGVIHIREALPAWSETSQSNGVLFSNGKIEVFASAVSGTISITTVDEH